MKKFAGYLIFSAYLSLAGILYLYISKPATSSGPHILCGGHNQNAYVSPRDGNLTLEIILRPKDEQYKAHRETSDQNGSRNSPRIIYC
jgi:hypothetical protein